jgi:hypothetical protein
MPRRDRKKPPPVTARLWRSETGLFVHLPGCRHARTPWVWANDKTDSEVRRVAEAMGYHLCKQCQPLGSEQPEVKLVVGTLVVTVIEGEP